MQTAEQAVQRAQSQAKKAAAAIARCDSDAKQRAIEKAKGGAEAEPTPNIRMALQAELDAATAAVTELQREHAEAKRIDAGQRADVNRTVAWIISTHVGRLASELVELNERAHELRLKIQGLEYCQPGFQTLGQVRWPLPHDVISALRLLPPPMGVDVCTDPVGAWTRHWSSIRDALASDADAEIDPSSSAKPAKGSARLQSTKTRAVASAS